MANTASSLNQAKLSVVSPLYLSIKTAIATTACVAMINPAVSTLLLGWDLFDPIF